MKALTVDVIWAWAIIEGYKVIENRCWQTNHRGTLAIHAGKNKSRDKNAREILRKCGVPQPCKEHLESIRGKIIGVATLHRVEGTVRAPMISENPMLPGPIYWFLRHPKKLTNPISATGKLGIWEYDSFRINEQIQ